MSENSDQGTTNGSGKAFFDRADEVGQTGNWDYAIDLYLRGILRDADNVDSGHQPLREVSLNRKLHGGKGPGIVDKFKRRSGKDPLQNLINAEYLLAMEPGSVEFMEQVLKTSRALEIPTTVKWICDILMEAMRQASRPNKRILLLLIDAYQEVEDYPSAISACDMAHQLSPEDRVLEERLTDLSTKYTLQEGKYDGKGDFTQGVKDMDKQKELFQRDALAQDESYLNQQVDAARKDYRESPAVSGKVNALVDALLKFEDLGYENEAIEVLTKAFKDQGAYQFKMRIGDIQIRQMNRRLRRLRSAGDKAALTKAFKESLAFELQEYTERSANYPTDLAIKYELGQRQFLAGKYDDAISSLQEARRDPRMHTAAMTYLGRAFAKKGWLQEAAETFETALRGELPEQRVKELRYFLGDVLERMGELHRAREQFSQVAMMDYNYKDVRDRVENIRKKLQEDDNDGPDA